ncbi:MAG TPA: DUF4295 domain-containing protein [Bacteroidales bacterium]|nr:DUF4295 domain-containing protein [Bacteroidales bacterium]HPE57718.1 DUF4295 domain-containing protein [Bacteroidales bacterium]HRX96884.1 DUF4295 domain-containing protein [Bacteroidales bacterium]
MAKKVVASLQSGTKNYAKVIKMVKSPKSGAYSFKENVMHVDQIKDYLAKK